MSASNLSSDSLWNIFTRPINRNIYKTRIGSHDNSVWIDKNLKTQTVMWYKVSSESNWIQSSNRKFWSVSAIQIEWAGLALRELNNLIFKFSLFSARFCLFHAQRRFDLFELSLQLHPLFLRSTRVCWALARVTGVWTWGRRRACPPTFLRLLFWPFSFSITRFSWELLGLSFEPFRPTVIFIFRSWASLRRTVSPKGLKIVWEQVFRNLLCTINE